MATTAKPDAPSSDHIAMTPYWEMVDAILGGTVAMRAGGEKYLPKFMGELQADYDFRRKHAKFTNVFRDIVENLAAKPFAQEAGIADNTGSERIDALAEDIDGQGNHIHVFAGQTFYRGIAYAIDWIFVDYTKGVPSNATVAQEQAMGVRPYWVALPATRVLAAYSARIGGREQFVHVRIAEDLTERDGFGEKTTKQVRVLNREPIGNAEDGDAVAWAPPTYEVWREVKTNIVAGEWVKVEDGALSIDEIPLVPFMTGRRKGSSWQVVPSMQDAADLQIDLYQQENGLKNAKDATAFPMLSGNGFDPAKDEKGGPLPLPVGPKAVLYAPPNGTGSVGSWSYVEPNATSLRFLADDIKETIQQLRELGRQPLTAQTGGLTVVTTQFAAQKGNSAIQAWALSLKDAMENALRFTAMWLKEDKQPEFRISTDFDVGLYEQKDIDFLKFLRTNSDISRKAILVEAKRRNTLEPGFDIDADSEQMREEAPGEPTPEEIAAAAGVRPNDPEMN